MPRACTHPNSHHYEPCLHLSLSLSCCWSPISSCLHYFLFLFFFSSFSALDAQHRQKRTPHHANVKCACKCSFSCWSVCQIQSVHCAQRGATAGKKKERRIKKKKRTKNTVKDSILKSRNKNLSRRAVVPGGQGYRKRLRTKEKK